MVEEEGRSGVAQYYNHGGSGTHFGSRGQDSFGLSGESGGMILSILKGLVLVDYAFFLSVLVCVLFAR